MFENTVMKKNFPVNLFETITGTDVMPEDGVGTLYYLLERLSPTHKTLLLERYRTGLPYRKIGEIHGVSGARVESVVSKAVERLSKSKVMLVNGMAKTFKETSSKCTEEMTRKIEAECREKFTKEGYAMGYADGILKREKAFYSYGRYDEITINDLDLSNRSHTALQKHGIYTVSDIINVGNGLADIENLGKKSLEEIVRHLHDIGVDVDKHFKRIIMNYEIFFDDN